MKKHLRDYIFIFIFFAGISLISGYILLKNPKLISNEENRHLANFKYLELTSYFDGSFQSQIDNAYTDQFPKRNIIVNLKNKLDNLSRNILLKNISELTLVTIETADGYPLLRLGNSDRFINTIIENTEENQLRFKTRALEINALQKRFPDVKIFVYVPTQVHETSLFDAENNIIAGAPALWEIFEKNIIVPFKRFNLDSIDLYKKMYYMSDHHPTNIGADIFYNEIINFIKPEDTPLKSVSTDCHVGNTFYGTFGNRTGRITSPDEFCLNIYDLPEYKVIVNGEVPADYKYRNDFLNYQNSEPYPYHYNEAYKIYDPIMELDTNQKEKENLLIIGDSFSNSILDLLASHYNKTYRVTPYDFMIKNGYLFDYDTFIKENDINTVLFMYTAENYYYKDEINNADRFMQNTIKEGGK